MLHTTTKQTKMKKYISSMLERPQAGKENHKE